MEVNEGKVTTTRKEYKAIKKMDHQEVNAFMQVVFERGGKLTRLEKSQGILTGITISKDIMLEAMQQVKGIGEKRRAEVVDIFKELADEKVRELDASSKNLY